MKIKMLTTVMNKIDGIPGPFVKGVEYEFPQKTCDSFVVSGLAEYVDAPAPATYETAVDIPLIETPEDSAPVRGATFWRTR